MPSFKQLISLFEEKQEMGYAAGVCIFCPRTGRFLLQKRGPRIEDPGEHDWFGGGADEGEDILEAAIRELEEEGGIIAKPESLYPLARFGYQPEKGLGGYFIWLLVVDDEFPAKINYDGDAHDEVAASDWIGTKEWGSIKPHERVFALFADPTFVETLKKATHERIESGHVAKLNQRTDEGHYILGEVDWSKVKKAGKAAAMAGMIGMGAMGSQGAQAGGDFSFDLKAQGPSIEQGVLPSAFTVTSPQYGTFTISKEERAQVIKQSRDYARAKAAEVAKEKGLNNRRQRHMEDKYELLANSYYMEQLLKAKASGQQPAATQQQSQKASSSQWSGQTGTSGIVAQGQEGDEESF